MTAIDITERRERVIEEWMMTIIADGGVDRYDDLHLDKIDRGWQSQESWVDGGVEALRLATHVRDSHNLKLTVVLAFPLKLAEETPCIDIRSNQQLAMSLNWMPPSLYLFRPGQEFWNQTERTPDGRLVAEDISVKELEVGLFGPSSAKACYQMEFKRPETGEYSRSIFLAA